MAMNSVRILVGLVLMGVTSAADRCSTASTITPRRTKQDSEAQPRIAIAVSAQIAEPDPEYEREMFREPPMGRFFTDEELGEMWRECVEFDYEEDAKNDGKHT
jgi:hypothetical protein